MDNKNHRLLKIFLLCLFLVLPPLHISFAEVVHLKSGKKVEGKIMEETNDYIKIDFYGVTLTYFKSDIDKIEKSTDEVPTESNTDNSDKKKFYEMALQSFQKKEYDKAIEHCKEALKIDPNYAEAYYGLGMTYRAMGNEEKAMEYLQHSYYLSKKNPMGEAEKYYNEGVTFLETRQFDKAIQSFEKTIAVDSTKQYSALAYCNIGYIYNQQQNFEKSIEYFKKALEINPEDPEAYFSLGDAYWGLSKQKEAEDCYNKSMELFKKHGNEQKAKIVLMHMLSKQGHTVNIKE